MKTIFRAVYETYLLTDGLVFVKEISINIVNDVLLGTYHAQLKLHLTSL